MHNLTTVVISARAAAIMAAAGLGLLAVARALMYVTWALLPSVCLILDRLAVVRGQKSRSMPSSMPRIES